LELRERILEGSGPPTRKTDLREAEAQLKAGNPALALEKIEALLAADPKDPEALALKRKVEAVLNGGEEGAKKKSVRHRRSTPAPQEDPDSRGRADQAYNLGLESYRKGNWAGAKSFWEQALKNDPNHLQSRKALERLQAEQPGLK
jgi:Tfp pilus assembly protein PilF